MKTLVELMEKAESGHLRVGEALPFEEQVTKLSDTWIDFQDPEKVKIFLETVESDPGLSELVECASKKTGPVDVTHTVTEIRNAVKALPDPDKFVAMLYLDLKVGLVYISSKGLAFDLDEAADQYPELKKLKEILAEISQKSGKLGGKLRYVDFKEITDAHSDFLKKHGIDISFYKDGKSDPRYYRIETHLGSKYDALLTEKLFKEPGHLYRIGSWHQKCYQELASTFAISHLFRSWDEEIAIDDPYTHSWDLGWTRITETYLSEKLGESFSALIQKQRDFQKKLVSILEADKKLVELKKTFKKGDQKLKKYLGVEKLHLEFSSVEEIASLIQSAQSQQGDYFIVITGESGVKGDPHLPTPGDSEFLKTPEDARVWDLGHNRVVVSRRPIKLYWKTVKIIKDGKILADKVFPPYMVYEDFESGETHHYPEYDIDIDSEVVKKIVASLTKEKGGRK